MKCDKRVHVLALVVWAGLAFSAPVQAEIKLLAKGAIPADATDKSGLTGALEDGTPHNRLGSCGSAIAYTGKGNRFVLLADRGPKDGTTSFQCRFHFFDISVAKDQPTLKIALVDTKILKDESGRPFVGLSSAIDAAKPGQSLRLDPEGVRVGRSGTIFISDEYGPFLYQFTQEGRRLRTLPVPARFQLAQPHADPKKELGLNKHGRVPNKGMEGLAISPDGSKLYAGMQSPLIQDGGRKGKNVRILEIDVKSGDNREFLYPLDSNKTALSEILAINDHEFLVIERTGASKNPVTKIVKIDVSKASDISKLDMLPLEGIPEGVVPVAKTPFIDMRHPRWQLAGPEFPVKIEGLAFGPHLPDGRHLLLVTSDNDVVGDLPTNFYAFAIDPDDLPGFQSQIFARD
jgi:hypothetical protein